MEDSRPPTPRLPVESLRRIDWLAVAPWTLLLRAPAVSIGWPLVIGAVGSVLLGPLASNLVTPSAHVAVAWDAVSRQMAAPAEIFQLGPWWATALRLLGWPLVGLLITRCAAGPLTGSQTRSPRWPIRGVAQAYGRLFGAVALLAIFVGVMVAGLFLWGQAFKAPGLVYAAAAITPIVALVGILPLLAALITFGIGSPLMLAAITIDNADAFDGLSRMFAYVWQRIGTLVACVFLAITLGIAIFFAVEFGLGAVVATIATSVPRAFDREAAWVLSIAIEVTVRAARGIYPAYFFTAGTAVYLVMRHAIDGQPLDEMVLPADQPADGAA